MIPHPYIGLTVTADVYRASPAWLPEKARGLVVSVDRCFVLLNDGTNATAHILGVTLDPADFQVVKERLEVMWRNERDAQAKDYAMPPEEIAESLATYGANRTHGVGGAKSIAGKAP